MYTILHIYISHGPQWKHQSPIATELPGSHRKGLRGVLNATQTKWFSIGSIHFWVPYWRYWHREWDVWKLLSSSYPHHETLFWHSFWHVIWKYIYIWHSYSHTLSDILSGIYFAILSDILSGIYSDILPGIYSDILSGILSDILSGSLTVAWIRSELPKVPLQNPRCKEAIVFINVVNPMTNHTSWQSLFAPKTWTCSWLYHPQLPGFPTMSPQNTGVDFAWRKPREFPAVPSHFPVPSCRPHKHPERPRWRSTSW